MELTARDREGLRKIAQFEEHCDPQGLAGRIGFTWDNVGVWPATLNRLIAFGLLEVTYHSNSYRGMRLTELGRAQALVGIGIEITSQDHDEGFDLPGNIFDDIIGHDDIKDLLRAAIQAERPVHVLLAGPPALAKTLFLWDVERAAGERALWLVGSATSKAGLWDLAAERQPRVLMVDELDKMNAADTAALLSMMEGGRLVRAKKGRQLDVSHPLWVLAATNRTCRLSPELLSRFAVCRIEAYTRSDYLTVVKGVLVRREGVNGDTADEIAARLDGRTQDVRDAIRVSRLAAVVGVNRAIELLGLG